MVVTLSNNDKKAASKHVRRRKKIVLIALRFDDETELVITVGKYLVAFLRASKCRYVAAYAALRAVYAHFDYAAVLEFVRVRRIFECLLRVVVYAEFKWFVASNERKSVLAAHFEPTRVGVVAVLLRNEIVMLEICDFA